MLAQDLDRLSGVYRRTAAESIRCAIDAMATRTGLVLLALLSTMSNYDVGTAAAQSAGTCAQTMADAYLDIGNVRARLFNNGTLFWDGHPAVYDVPKDGGLSTLFASNFWVSGIVNGEHRAAITYHNRFQREFWPGPLDDAGNPPEDCTDYDRIYSVSVADVLLYEWVGYLTDDLREWPAHLGAPVVDGDGVADNYNLKGGDRPRLLGHQMAWWIMNDVGNEHPVIGTNPLGLQVSVSAFATATGDPILDNATFYRYQLSYHGSAPAESTYVALQLDPTIGFWDDYAGVDTTRDLAFAYNGTNYDEHYPAPLPAFGVDVLQGPGFTGGKEPIRLGIETFIVDNNLNDNIDYKAIVRNTITGHFSDGRRVLDGCYDFRYTVQPPEGCLANASLEFTGIMFPGDPVTSTPVSQNALDGMGAVDDPGYAKMMIGSGPFTMNPGDTQDIVFGYLWARGADHIDSITELRAASDDVQARWDTGYFDSPAVPESPPLSKPDLILPANGATGQPLQTRLHWSPVDGAVSFLVEFGQHPDLGDADTNIVSSAVVYGCQDRSPNRISACSTWLATDTLGIDQRYYWRVTPIGQSEIGPPSAIGSFDTSTSPDDQLGAVLRLSDGSPAYVEIAGPSGSYPCEANPEDIGCVEVGGKLVAEGAANLGDYYLFFSEQTIGRFAPRDYELRFDGDLHWGLARVEDSVTSEFVRRLIRVPFSAWDIGNVGPFGINNAADDTRLIPMLWPDAKCDEGYRYDTGISVYYPTEFAADFQHWADSVTVGLPSIGECFVLPGMDTLEVRQPGPPLSGYILANPDGQSTADERPPAGTTIRLLTTDYGIPVPVQAAPADGSVAVSQPVRLWFTPLQRYVSDLETQVEVASSSGFESVSIVASGSAVGTYFNLPELSANSGYYWRARTGYRRPGVYGNWSDTWSFVAGSPTVAEESENLEVVADLLPAFPNPARNDATIPIRLGTATEVTVKIYDVIGREIAVLYDGFLSAGEHEFAWRRPPASGVYFVRLTAGTDRDVVPVVVAR